MNKLAIVIFLASLFAGPAVQAADEEDHAAHHPDASPTVDSKTEEAGMGGMGDNMKKMREQMSRIHSTSDPQERQKLMEEHMQSMQDAMKAMKGMGGMKMGMMDGKKCPGMDEDAAEEMGGDIDEDHDSAGTADKGAMDCKCKMMESAKRRGMMKMHKMMEVRMDMMQKMMDQMLQHEQAEHAR